jgi:L-iditol 2-dehydrogenase
VLALTLKEYNRFVLEDVPTPSVAADSVLVAVKACGICGSDVHGMDGSTGRRKPPIIMGHEAAGVVVEAGPKAVAWEPGARVTFDSTIYCGECEFCRQGQINLCNQRRVLGVSCDEYRQNGALAQFVTVPQRVLYRLPNALPFEHAALAEPLSIAFHALRRAAVKASDSVVVIGAGLIGLLLVQSLRRAGCKRILAVDLAQEKLALARTLGATASITSGPNALREIMEWTDGHGADAVFEAVGVPATVDLAVRSARKGGSVTLVGNVAPKVELPLQVCVTRELSIYGSCASAGEYPACIEALANGEIEAAPLLSAIAPLAEGPQWFDRLYRKEPGLVKVILQP